MKKMRVRAFLVFDIKFFALLPAINLNLHSKELEFEWLFFGAYISVTKAT